MSEASSTSRTRKGFKEFVRKKIVGLKRSPQTIPLVFLLVSFVIYSFNLMAVSKTTVVVQSGAGICEFAIMLFSILAFVAFLRSFPKRKKPILPMLILLFAMLGIIIFCDIYYYTQIENALKGVDRPAPLDIELYPDIPTAKAMLVVHIIFLIISFVLIATLPIYGKLIKKINTSVEIEENEGMAEIDISGEDE